MKKLFLLISIVTLSMAVNAGLEVPIPSTDFSEGYFFEAQNAMLDGDIEFNNLSGSDYLRYYDRSPNGTASWFVTVTKPCLVSVTLNMFDNSWNYDGNDDARKIYKNGGHIFKVRIIDESETPKDSVFEASESSSIGDIALSGTLYFEEAGTYLIELLNSRAWSKCGISGITLTAVSIPETGFASAYSFVADAATLHGADANFLLETSVTPHYIRYADHSQPGPYVTWDIASTRACYVDVTLNFADNSSFYSGNKHIMQVLLLDGYGNPIDSVAEGPAFVGDGFTENGVDKTLSGTLHIPAAGIYTIKMLNNRNHSKTGIYGVTLAYFGGAVQNITNEEDFETNINDAWYSSGGSRADGKISLPESTMSSAWVCWNIHVESSDFYNININFEKGSADHTCGVKIYNAETTVFDKHESRSSAASPTDLGRTFIPAGDYILEYTNDLDWSTAKLISIEFIPFVAPTTTLPETLDPNDAIYTSLVYVDGGDLYFTPSNKTGYILDQWAQWKVRVNTAGAFLFTINVTSTLEQIYKISILDSESNELYSYENNPGSGSKTIKHYFNLATGNYFVKVQNTKQWSDGHMVSLGVSQPSIVTLDEEAETDAVIMDNNRTSDPINVQIIRTITAGMYNTFCLPFDLTLKEFKGIFGKDAMLKEMESAELEGDFVLNLNFRDATSVYRCKPYLIMTSSNIVNPAFADVTIKAEEEDKYVTTGTNADFISTLIATELDADPDNLFLAADNKIYFPQNNPMPINGFRAYFHVHNVPAGAIQRARIIEQGNVVTEVDLVNGELQFTDKQVHKTIEDGQLLIIRDGIRYNALGNKIK